MELETTAILSDPELSWGMNLHMAGITHPNPRYRMKRWNRTGYYIFEYVLSGSGVLESEDTAYYPQGGDAYVIAQGMPCEYYSSRHDPWEKIWINVNGELIDALCLHYQINGVMYFPQCNLENEFRQAINIVFNGGTSAYRELALAIHRIIARLYECKAALHAPGRECSEEAQILKKHLDDYWMVKFSQKKLCSLINKSPAQMQRIFKKEFGISPGQYAQQKRLKMAIGYLENTNFTVRRIAEHLGFSNEYYFANWFKEQTGVAPKSYLNKLQNEQ